MKFDVDALVSSNVPGLGQAVGQDAFSVDDLSVDSGDQDIEVFDQPLTLGGDVSATASILAANAQVDDPFGSGDTLSAPGGTSFASFQLDANAHLSGQASPSIKGASLNLKATAGGGISYRHLLPVSQTETRLDALKAVLQGVELPSLVQFKDLAPGASHSATAKAQLDFNADFSAGTSAQKTLQTTLFDGVSVQAQVQGSASISAALGMSLYDTMVFTVGRGSGADDWYRLRLDKLNKRSLSLSSTLQLQVDYDFGSSLISILENALNQVPIPPLLTTLQEVNGLLASGDWTTVQSKISAQGTEILNEWLDTTGWKDWVAGSPEVAQFIELSNKVVNAFNSLDARVQSLWSQLLGKADLGPGSKLRQALEKLAAIDPSNVTVMESLTDNNDVNEVLSLVQHLTGETLDDILLDSIPGAQDTLRQAVGYAQQAVQFLTNTPQDVLDKIHDFANRAGITQTVQFLAANGTSTASIEAYVSNRIAKLVETLVGKAWNKISASDLQKVQSWAQKLQPILETPNTVRTELENTVKGALQKLIGQAGFTATLSIDFESTRSALLDIEIDPKERKFQRRIEKAMEDGSVQEILDRLVEADFALVSADDDSDDAKKEAKPLPFRIRECVFTSRRVRSRSFGLSFHGFGISINRQGIVQRIEEARTEILSASGAGQAVRQGTYSAGFTRRDVLDASSNETAIWLESTAQGSGLDFSKAYGGKPQPKLRLVYTREDTKATADELTAMSQLLEGFGFEPQGVIEQKVPEGWTTQLSVSLSFIDKNGEALEALVQGTGNASGWNPDFLDANRAWLTRSIDNRFLVNRPDVSWGNYLEALTRTDVFQENWTSGTFPFLRAASSRWGNVPVTSKSGAMRQVPVKWTTEPNVDKPNMELGLLYGSLLPKRAKGVAAKQRTLQAWQTLQGGHNDANYRALSRRFVDGCLRSAVYGPTWPSSMSILWLTLERIERRQRELLENARGVALLRFRADNNEDWQDPLRWTLAHGVLAQNI